MNRFARSSVVPAPPAAVFRWHEQPAALRRLTPWWSGARIVRPAASLRQGERALIRLGFGPVGVDWEAEHVAYAPPARFEERQVPGRGPFRAWHHRHLTLPHPGGTLLRDEIRYAVPGGPLAPLLDRLLVRPALRALFRHRHAVTRAAFAGVAAAPARDAGEVAAG